MTVESTTRLAIDGGTPVRTRPFQSWPIWDEHDEQALLRALHSGVWGVGGEETEQLEQELAALHGTRYALTVTNGTAALEAALRACGVGYGDEVIVPPYTFIATASACLLVGAVPIFADIDPETYTLDPAVVEALITPRTKAIVPVHIGGYPADMDRLCEIAQRHGLRVLEDAAQAIGAQWRGRAVGSIGDLGTLSFQSSKNINAGEGGAIMTNDDTLFERCWAFKNCGRVRGGAWYRHDSLGDNFRMTQFQAALLRSQLTHLEAWAERRAENVRYLLDGLREVGGLIPQRADERVTRHGYHLLIVRYQPEAFGGWNREQFLNAIRAEGIPASPGYVPLYGTLGIQQGIRELCAALGRPEPPAPDCPVNEHACRNEAIWLVGQSPLLGTRADMDDVVQAVAKLRAHAG
jgi:dTDP-4-amino-4,6-dideoxygalactose transaminase